MRCHRRTVIAGGLALLVWPQAAAPVDAGRATLVGSYAWQDRQPGFGGFSGLELGPDGLAITVLSDRGYILQGRVSRDARGAITGIETGEKWPVLSENGAWLKGIHNDSEGLALAPQGGVYVSFEGNARVAWIPGPGQPAQVLPRPPEFARMRRNGSLEALAVGPDGSLYTLPEEIPPGETAFPLWRFRKGRWQQPFSVPARGGFHPVGADFGPDGRLYLLERRLALPFGFASRVRRFEVGETTLANEVELLATRPGTHPNLEGIAVWRGADDTIRLTMVSDNDQMFFIKTRLVDYRID